MKLRETLYVRIAGLLSLLLLVLSFALYTVFISSFEWLSKESEQQLNLTLASHIAADLTPDMRDGLDISLIERRLASFAARYPRIDLFVLAQDGQVVATSIGPIDRRIEPVDLAPVRTFLDTTAQPKLPLYGQDPITRSYSEVFSVAEVRGGDQKYFLYVVLTGTIYREIMQYLSTGHTMRSTIAAGLLATVATAALGILLFFVLTTRFRRLVSGIRRIERGEYDTALPVEGKDEVASVARAVNEMSKRIVAEMRSKEQSDALRRNLVARVSHDLRAPLTGLRGHLERLSISLADNAQGAQARHTEAALESALALQFLIDDLFELSKLEARDKAPRPDTFSMLELVRDVVRRAQPLAEAAGVTVSVSVEATVVTDVYADPTMLSRALQNLLDNAIRACAPGGSVTIFLTEVSTGLCVAIQDSGTGISEDDLAHVFDAFFSTRADTGGTGLGLAIVKRIIEAHDAELTVESTPGQGSTFSFIVASKEATRITSSKPDTHQVDY